MIPVDREAEIKLINKAWQDIKEAIIMSDHSKNVAAINPHGSPSVTAASKSIASNTINNPDTGTPPVMGGNQQSGGYVGPVTVHAPPEAYKPNIGSENAGSQQTGNPSPSGGGQQQPIRGSSVFNQKTNKNF